MTRRRAQFFESHPGGATPLLKAAGRDASNVSPAARGKGKFDCFVI